MSTIKIDRLVGILAILLQNEKVTAPYLATRFEVSRRTINRDIEDICKAGIPIVTFQGVNGGISIAEGYKIDKSVFTTKELGEIFIGLQSLNSISKDSKYMQLMDKFQVNTESIYSVQNNILIDLSSHYKSSLSTKIDSIRMAIEGRKLIEFDYFYDKGETRRQIEPYLVVFKWSSWYVYGYCVDRKAFRMFKLNRLWHLEITDRSFELRQVPQEEKRFDSYFKEDILLVAIFDATVKYRIIEEYGVDSFLVNEDGTLLVKKYFTSKNNLLEWILSFGDKVEVIKPEELREELRLQGERIQKKYL